MPRVMETWSGELAAPPEVVGRQVHIPVRLFEFPDRPVVIVISLSRSERFIRKLAEVIAKARTRASMVLPGADGDGDEGRPSAR